MCSTARSRYRLGLIISYHLWRDVALKYAHRFFLGSGVAMFAHFEEKWSKPKTDRGICGHAPV
jgi:hypothetical protein